MKWGSRGACALLSSCLLLACALSAAAVGLKCFALGSELKGEPFRLGSAAGAFYSGLLLAAGLALLGAALFCCRSREEEQRHQHPQYPQYPHHPQQNQSNAVAAVPVSDEDHLPPPPLPPFAAAAPEPAPDPPPPPLSPKAAAASPGGRQNFLLLGVLVFMLGVLSAFAGAVIDGDTVSLVEKKYSHYCLLPQTGNTGGGGGSSSSSSSSSSGPRRSSSSSSSSSDVALRCQKLRDYQRGLVISTIFNALECLLGLLNLLLVKNYKAAQQRGQRRRRRRRTTAREAQHHQQHHPPRRRRRRRRRQQHQRGFGGAGGPPGPSAPQGSLVFSSSSEDPLEPFPFQAVSYINVGVFHVLDEAGVEVHCGGHPSLELPGYSPMDPDLEASYPYCYPLPNEQPPAYEEIYPREVCPVNRL